jgi:hypothetical protein
MPLSLTDNSASVTLSKIASIGVVLVSDCVSDPDFRHGRARPDVAIFEGAWVLIPGYYLSPSDPDDDAFLIASVISLDTDPLVTLIKVFWST